MFIFALPTFALGAVFLVVCLIAWLNLKNQDKNGKKAPGPISLPIIGGLHFIGRYPDPTAAFCELGKIYGNVVSIKMGTMNCVVISGYKTFRKVLCSSSFDARPDFKRINLMFGGNRNNSLAFTDYTETHHKSRNIIAAFSLARNTSSVFETLDSVATDYIVRFVEQVRSETNNGESIAVKDMLTRYIAQSFVQYFCSMDIGNKDAEFDKFTDAFNEIFEEVNEPCVGDVLPYLMNFINKDHVIEASQTIRSFVHDRCLKSKMDQRKLRETNDINNNKDKASNLSQPKDLMDALIDATENADGLTLDQALFALEDILGGHSAVVHTVIRMLIYIAARPEVQEKIQQEVRANCTGVATMTSKLAYTEATAFECLRFISSQIVPHKATEDTEIDGWEIKKDTVVMFNNYDLHFSPDLWPEPESFQPERFLTDDGSRVFKPEFFVPFSTGRRTCLGQKILMKMSVTIIANLCHTFELGLDTTENYCVARCCLAVGKKPYKFTFKPREC